MFDYNDAVRAAVSETRLLKYFLAILLYEYNHVIAAEVPAYTNGVTFDIVI
jgi:hypothetical protein